MWRIRMPRKAVPVAVLLCALIAAHGSLSAADIASNRALLDKYCVTCHNDRAKTAGLSLAKLDLVKVAADAEVWEKVVRKLRTDAMPPAGAPRPDRNSADAFAGYLETALDAAAATQPNPGRPAV